jgi:type I restriction-modification system DNA methylase subunit
MAARNRKEELVKTEEEKEFVNKGFYGTEMTNHMFFLGYANFHFNGMEVDNIYNQNCFDNLQGIEEFKPTCGLLNPPYSQCKTAKDWKKHELNFCKRAMSYIEKGGKFACIIPEGCGISDADHVVKLRREILEENTLDTIIKVNAQAFPNYGASTMIYIFKCGIPHNFDTPVFCVDYSEDGFYVKKSKAAVRDGVDAEALEREIIDICSNRKKVDISNFRKLEDENDDWCYIYETSYLTKKNNLNTLNFEIWKNV